MQFRHLLPAAAGLFLAVHSFALPCTHKNGGVKAKTTVATPEENYYEVNYVKIDLSATNTSTAISGSSTTKAVVTAPSMAEYYFELNSQLTVDSALFNGTPVSVTNVNSFVSKIVLPSALPQGSPFTAQVFYHGAPVGGAGFFTIGILNGIDPTYGDTITHTVSAAFHSRDWFPCKQSLTDKIDSADIWITVPAGLKVASNGLLQNITPVTGNMQRFEWSTRYPTDYYLLSFAVGRYNEYNYYMHFDGSTDSMLVQNYIYDDPAILQNHGDELDSVAYVINHFSDLFGRYPFYAEKTGTVLVPLSGGMENQTMVSLGSLDIELIAHELAHQWWGDHVTCGTIADMWLNEGWATYCEHLYLEHFHGPAAARAFRNACFNTVTTSTGGSVYVSDTTDELRIYSSRLTYNKGAAVAHMLRYHINNDSLFRVLMQEYQSQFSNATATTADLNVLANQISGQSLDTFFKQWVYKEGYPTYSAKWAQSGNTVYVRLSHTSSKPASVPVFKLPVEIKLTSAAGDTTIRVYNDQSSQLYSFTWNNTMNGMAIDPDNHIVNKQGTIVNDPSLSVGNISGKKLTVFPNPADSQWIIRDVPTGAVLTLTDVNGRILNRVTASDTEVIIPAAGLPGGVYTLSVMHKEMTPLSLHLLKQ